MKSEKCGVYQIICRINGKSYIGSSRQIYTRWSKHRYLLRHGKNGCWRLQLAWTKHGEEAFRFVVLEECDASNLEVREQFYIDKHKPAYNVVKNLELGPIALAIHSNRERAASITHCPHGHLYDEANTYYGRNGGKICRKCNAERVAAMLARETEEERKTRLAKLKASHKANREARLAKQKEYAKAHKEEKREYDKNHRLEFVERRRIKRQNETEEQKEERRRKKRIAYHKSLGRGEVDTWKRGSPSEETKAQISKTLTGRNLKPVKEPWKQLGISKTTYYRRFHSVNDVSFSCV